MERRAKPEPEPSLEERSLCGTGLEGEESWSQDFKNSGPLADEGLQTSLRGMLGFFLNLELSSRNPA